ncbi:hypothetical protein GF322_00600 [Candidatus Dependentiae bacterium]|nr:hypothetical protein [Candidatus Dependentiae bacterium]
MNKKCTLASWLFFVLFTFDLAAQALRFGDVVFIEPDPARKKSDWYLTVRKDPNVDFRKVKNPDDEEKFVLINPFKIKSNNEIKYGDKVAIQSFYSTKFVVAEAKKNEVATKMFSNLKAGLLGDLTAQWTVEGERIGAVVNIGDIVSFKSFNNRYLRGGHSGKIHPNDVDLAKDAKSNEKWVLRRRLGTIIREKRKEEPVQPARPEARASKRDKKGYEEYESLPKGFYPLMPGGVEKISVGTNAQGKTLVWGIGQYGGIWQADIQFGQRNIPVKIEWKSIPGNAKDINVGSNGVIVAIARTGKPFIWSDRNWDPLTDENLIKIAVGKNQDDIWGVTKTDELVHLENGQWNKKTDRQYKYVDAASDGTVVCIDLNNNVYISIDGIEFNQIPRLKLDEVSVARRDLMRGIYKGNLFWLNNKGEWTKAARGRNLIEFELNEIGDLIAIINRTVPRGDNMPSGYMMFYKKIPVPRVAMGAMKIETTVVREGETPSVTTRTTNLEAGLEEALKEETPMGKIEKLMVVVEDAKNNNLAFPEANAATKQYRFVNAIQELYNNLYILPSDNPLLKRFYDLLIKVQAYEPLYGNYGDYVKGFMSSLKDKGVDVPPIEIPKPGAVFEEVLKASIARPSIDAQIDSLKILTDWVGSKELSLFERAPLVMALKDLAMKIRELPTTNDAEKKIKQNLQTKYSEFLQSIKEKENMLGPSGMQDVETIIKELPKSPAAAPATQPQPASTPQPQPAPAAQPQPVPAAQPRLPSAPVVKKGGGRR